MGKSHMIAAVDLGITPPARASEEKVKRAEEIRQGYRLRIDQLRAYAVDDGRDLDPSSERDFWHFLRGKPCIKRGNLALLDNGCLRAVWKSEDGTHVGLQFLGNRIVQYVIFRRTSADGSIVRSAGRDSIDDVLRRIESRDLQPLFHA